MPLISLAMIVKNEEATLAHCMESVKPLVDEMIVVDTGSTDETISIARNFGARVYHFQWRDDFAAARNESLKHCKCDWALVLDGDEAIDPLDYEKIKNACLHPFADAYKLIHRHYMLKPNTTLQDSKTVLNKSKYDEGKNMPFYSDIWNGRLARMTAGLSFTGSIHETFEPLLLSQGKEIPCLDAVIHHYGKLFDDRNEYKIQYYFTLTQREAEKKPNDILAQYNLLQQALVAKQWEIALGAARACRNLGVNTSFVLYGGGHALQELGMHECAIKYFDDLLRQEPRHTLATLRKGASYKELGNVNMARQLMTAAIGMEPDFLPAYGRLVDLELSVNNFDTARQTVLDAIKIAPDESDLYNQLVKIEIDRNNQQQAVCDALLGLKHCPTGGNGIWHCLVAAHLWDTGNYETAKSILTSGLKVFPDDPRLSRLKKMISGSKNYSDKADHDA